MICAVETQQLHYVYITELLDKKVTAADLYGRTEKGIVLFFSPSSILSAVLFWMLLTSADTKYKNLVQFDCHHTPSVHAGIKPY